MKKEMHSIYGKVSDNISQEKSIVEKLSLKAKFFRRETFYYKIVRVRVKRENFFFVLGVNGLLFNILYNL